MGTNKKKKKNKIVVSSDDESDGHSGSKEGNGDNDSDSGESKDEDAVPPTIPRCEHCDALKVLQGILKRRMRSRVRATEHLDSARLKKVACLGRSGSKTGRTKHVHHPNLNGTHSRASDKKGRPLKREELPVVEEEDVNVDSEVDFVGGQNGETRSSEEEPQEVKYLVEDGL